MPKKPVAASLESESTGQRLQRFRKAKGLTQTELGQLVNVTQRVITYYENEGGSLSPELVRHLAETLDVSTDELLGREAPSQKTSRPSPRSLRLWRRLKKIEELPLRDRNAVLRMIDMMVEGCRFSRAWVHFDEFYPLKRDHAGKSD